MTPFKILTIKLPDNTITDERLMALAEIEQEITNYCNINAVPRALYFTWVNMAIDLLRYQQEVNRPTDRDGDDEDMAGKVSAISEGDTSVSFGNKSVAETDRERLLGDHRLMLNSLILNYKQQLQKFRKVVF